MIVDLHSDLLLDVEHRRRRGERDVFRRRHLPLLAAAGVRVQVLAVFVESAYVPDGALRRAFRLVDAALHEEADSEGALRLVATRRELDEALAAGAVAGILGLEGAEPLGREPELVRSFARLGVRLIGPTWNRANAFADGAGELGGAGLTPLGERLLDELAAAGLALDLAHLSPHGVERALARFAGPLCCSHANVAGVYPNPRNLAGETIAAIAERGGVCGLNFLRVFIGPGEPAERLAAHYRGLVAAGGPGVAACGADFTDFLPPGPAEAPGLGLPPGTDRSLAQLPPLPRDRSYADLAAALRRGGVSDADVDALLFGNALAFLRRALP